MSIKYIILVAAICSCHNSILKSKTKEFSNATTQNLPFLNYYPYPHKLLIYSSKNGFGGAAYWKMLTKEKEKWYLVHCTFKMAVAVGESHYKFTKVAIDQSVANSMVAFLNSNKIWEIKNTDNGCEESEYKLRNKFGKIDPCVVHDGYTSVITIVVKSKAMIKRYYRPEVWEDPACCPGNKDRQAFIRCFNLLEGLAK